MKDKYKNIAPVYDRVTASFLQKPRQAIGQVLAKFKIGRVLDLGCGTGILLSFLARQGIDSVGLDFSAAMLQKAALQNAVLHRATKQASRFNLVQGSGEKLPFSPASFDAVVCALILHESEIAPEILLEESFKTAPLVVVLDWRMPERNLDYLLTFWVHGIERLAGKKHYANFLSFMKSGGLNGLAERAGSKVIYEESLKCEALTLAVLEKVD